MKLQFFDQIIIKIVKIAVTKCHKIVFVTIDNSKLI